MLCSRCMQREANVFFSKNINGKKEEYKVCDVCAKDMGLLSNTGVMVSMSDFIGQFVGKGIGNSFEQTFACPKCHTTIEEFSKTSKFGCGECYEAFKNELSPMLKRIQGNTEHMGKLPSRAKESSIIKKKINQLKAKLSDAVEKENFELAAKLRDEIKELSKDIEKE